MNQVEEFKNTDIESAKDHRGIRVKLLESYCEGMYSIYECDAARVRVTLKLLTINQQICRTLFKNLINVSFDDAVIQIVIRESENNTNTLRTLAINKVLSYYKIAQSQSKRIFELDAIIFSDCYVTFRHRSIPIQFFSNFMIRTTTARQDNLDLYTRDRFRKQITRTLQGMHNLKLVHVNLSEENIWYSTNLHRPVLSGFEISRSIMEEQMEMTKMTEYPGRGKYQSDHMKELKLVISSPNFGNSRLVRSRDVNMYRNDKQALTDSLKKIDSWVVGGIHRTQQIRHLQSNYTQKSGQIPHTQLHQLLRQSCVYGFAFTRPFSELKAIIIKFQLIEDTAFVDGLYKKLAVLYDQQQRTTDQLDLQNYLVENGADTPQKLIHRAELYIRLNRLSEAEQLIKELPNKYLVKMQLQARLYISHKRPELALQLLRKILTSLQNQPRHRSISTQSLMGEAYLEINDPESALICFERCLNIIQEAQNTGVDRHYKKRLEIYEMKMRNNIASIFLERSVQLSLQKFEQCLELQKTKLGPCNCHIFIPTYNAVIALIRNGEYNKAFSYLKLCESQIGKTENKIMLYRQLAVMRKQLCCLTGLKETESGIQIKEEKNETLTEIFNGSVQLILQEDCSTRLLQQNIANSTSVSFMDNVEYRKRLSLSLIKSNINIQANQQLTKAIAYFTFNIKPNTMMYQQNLLSLAELYLLLITNDDKVYFNQQKLDEIYNYFDKQRCKPMIGLTCLIAGLYAQKNEAYQQALTHIQNATKIYQELCSNCSESLNALNQIICRLCYKLGLFERVRNIYREAVKQNASRPNMFQFLADMDFQNSQYHNAIQDYRRFIKSHTTSEQRIEQHDILRVQSRIAECFLKIGDLESALEYYHKSQKLNSSDIYLQIAQIYENRRQYGHAYSYYTKLNFNQNPKLCKQIAKLCTKQPSLNNKIHEYLAQYMKYLNRDRMALKVDPDIYKIMISSETLSTEQKIKCLNKYFSIVQGKQKKQTYYNFTNNPEELLKLRKLLADYYFDMSNFNSAYQHYQTLYLNPLLKADIIYRMLQCSIKLNIQDQALYLDAMRLYEKIKGAKHPQTISLIRSLGSFMYRQQKYLQAYVYCSKCLEFVGVENREELVDQVYACFDKLGQEGEGEGVVMFEGIDWAENKLEKLKTIRQLIKGLQLKHNKALEEQFFLECYMIDPVPHQFCRKHTSMIPQLFN